MPFLIRRVVVLPPLNMQATYLACLNICLCCPTVPNPESTHGFGKRLHAALVPATSGVRKLDQTGDMKPSACAMDAGPVRGYILGYSPLLGSGQLRNNQLEIDHG